MIYILMIWELEINDRSKGNSKKRKKETRCGDRGWIKLHGRKVFDFWNEKRIETFNWTETSLEYRRPIK